MTYDDIIYDRDETGIVTITINRPDKLNAFNAHTVDELIDAFQAAWKASISSSTVWALKALSLSGRLIVIVTMPVASRS